MSTYNDFTPETASLLSTLRANGFTIWGGSNGEADFKLSDFADEAAFLAELLACDEASLRIYRKATKESVKTPGKLVPRIYGLYLVLGNSPGELVADYGIPSDAEDCAALETATNAHARAWFGRVQPTSSS